jgi:hypothetical protein
MPLASFAPTASVTLDATTVSAAVTLPTTGTPTTALVSNVSAVPVFVSLIATATANAGVPVMPWGQIALTIGSNTQIAAITDYGTAGLMITVGS